MSSGTRSNVEKNNEIINFMKSEEFAEIISVIVARENEIIRNEVTELREEVRILKETNIELIHLLDNKNRYERYSTSISTNISKTTDKPKAVSFANNTVKTSGRSTQKYTELKISEKHKPVKSLTESELIIPQNLEKDEQTKENSWVTLVRKSPKRRAEVVTGSDKNVTSIRGVTRYRHLHVYRVDPGMKPEELVDYLKTKNIPDAQCEKLTNKYPNIYSSFKISIPAKLYDTAMKPETWPEDVCVNHFFEHIARKQKAT